VDDVVVKTKQSGTLLDDLKETFANLRRYRMKLNPEKVHLWRVGWTAPRLYRFPARDRG
jgi:hypothetical protein